MPERRRIVVVTPRGPIPFGNADSRWYYVLLRGLVERGYDVTGLSACRSTAEAELTQQYFPRGEYDVRTFVYPHRTGPWSRFQSWLRPHSYMFSQEFHATLEAELRRGFSVLHLEQLCAGWLGFKYAHSSLLNIHNLTSIDLTNAKEADKSLLPEWRLAKRAETAILPRYPYIRTLTKRLEQAVRQSATTAKVSTVPIGIDTTLYRYIPEHERTAEPVITLIGSMDWYPSVSAAKRLISRLWPRIKEKVPAAQLRIIGWHAKSCLKEFVGTPDVTVLENVESTTDYFRQTGVFVYAPECGTGMKVKILEAMAYGVPIVTTSEGVEGFPEEVKDILETADDDAGIVNRAVEMLVNREKQNTSRAVGRQLVEQYCSPRPTLDGIEELYQPLFRRRS
ncbi:MAG: glycosyltransferase family 4 protein [Pirellulales bacterium]